MADLNAQFDEQKKSVERFLEEEREERNSQYDDMIGRVDKEKRERAKGRMFHSDMTSAKI